MLSSILGFFGGGVLLLAIIAAICYLIISEENAIRREYCYTNDNGYDYRVKVKLYCEPELARKTLDRYHTTRKELCNMLNNNQSYVDAMEDFDFALFLAADEIKQEMMIWNYSCKYYDIERYNLRFITKPREEADCSRSMFRLFGSMFAIIFVLWVVMFIRSNEKSGYEVLVLSVMLAALVLYCIIRLLMVKRKFKKSAEHDAMIKKSKLSEYQYVCHDY